MAPTLKDGAWALARLGKAPKVGEVVIARHPLDSSLIIKRLVKIEEDGYWLQGDGMRDATATSSQDSWVFGALKREDILGVVIWPRMIPKVLLESGTKISYFISLFAYSSSTTSIVKFPPSNALMNSSTLSGSMKVAGISMNVSSNGESKTQVPFSRLKLPSLEL